MSHARLTGHAIKVNRKIPQVASMRIYTDSFVEICVRVLRMLSELKKKRPDSFADAPLFCDAWKGVFGSFPL